MKLRTTRRNMENNFHKIVRIGYCDAQSLLRYQSPFAYSCGVYGWNGDYYNIDGVLIATGYRSLPNSRNVKCDYNTVKEYENRAEKAKNAEEVNAILKDFIARITE